MVNPTDKAGSAEEEEDEDEEEDDEEEMFAFYVSGYNMLSTYFFLCVPL